MKVLKHLSTAAFILASCGFVSSVAAAAATTSYAVPYLKYPQEKDLWCWVACAQMSGKQAYPSSTRTQSQAVQYVKNSTENVSGTLEETEIAVEWITNNTIDYTATFSTLQYEALVSQMISEKIPICGWIDYDPTTGIEKNGHMVTVGAIDCGSTSSSRYVTYCDPLPVNVGVTVRVQFSTFLSTTTEKGLIRNWEATIYR